MDAQYLISMALEVVLETHREINRQMQESLRADQLALQHKVRERSMLMTKKRDMIAKQEENEKLVDDFMVFVDAIETNDVEISQNFDEKAIMNSIRTQMNTDAAT